VRVVEQAIVGFTAMLLEHRAAWAEKTKGNTLDNDVGMRLKALPMFLGLPQVRLG
jgi:hypothetical protein